MSQGERKNSNKKERSRQVCQFFMGLTPFTNSRVVQAIDSFAI